MKKLIVCMTKSLAVAGIFGGVSFSNGTITAGHLKKVKKS